MPKASLGVAKPVNKLQKRGSFRIFGIVIPSLNLSNNILGYAVLDVKNFKTKLFTEVQTKELLARYSFENAALKLDKSQLNRVKDYYSNKNDIPMKEDELLLVTARELNEIYKQDELRKIVQLSVIENTECAMSRLMQFDRSGKVVGNVGITILAEIDGFKDNGLERGFQVINSQGQVASMGERKLLSLLGYSLDGQKITDEPLPLINGKIVTKGQVGISAIKKPFPKITKEDFDRMKGVPKVSKQNLENNAIHLSKVIDKFNDCIIRSCDFKRFWGVDNSFPKQMEKTKAYKSFKRDIRIYVEEYAKEKYKGIVETADRIYGVDNHNYEKLLAIVKLSVYLDTFSIDNTNILLKPFRGFNQEWCIHQLINKDFMTFVKEYNHTSSASIYNFLGLIYLESKYLVESIGKAKGNSSADLVRLTRKGYYESYKYYRVLMYSDYKSKEKGIESSNTFSQIIGVYNSLNHKMLQKYAGVLPVTRYILNPCNLSIQTPKLENRTEMIVLEPASLIGIRQLGYCLKESAIDQGCDSNSIWREGNKLRYIFDELDISPNEISEIIKRATCFGDISYAVKLLHLKTRPHDYFGYNGSGVRSRLQWKIEDLGVQATVSVMTESILTILAIYNLELAMYLNNTYGLTDLDLEDIGHEEFILTDEDKIYYQTGGKFNKKELLKGKSWYGLSVMPGGLRSAIALSTNVEFTRDSEEFLNYLYLYK